VVQRLCRFRAGKEGDKPSHSPRLLRCLVCVIARVLLWLRVRTTTLWTFDATQQTSSFRINLRCQFVSFDQARCLLAGPARGAYRQAKWAMLLVQQQAKAGKDSAHHYRRTHKTQSLLCQSAGTHNNINQPTPNTGTQQTNTAEDKPTTHTQGVWGSYTHNFTHSTLTTHDMPASHRAHRDTHTQDSTSCETPAPAAHAQTQTRRPRLSGSQAPSGSLRLSQAPERPLQIQIGGVTERRRSVAVRDRGGGRAGTGASNACVRRWVRRRPPRLNRAAAAVTEPRRRAEAREERLPPPLVGVAVLPFEPGGAVSEVGNSGTGSCCCCCCCWWRWWWWLDLDSSAPASPPAPAVAVEWDEDWCTGRTRWDTDVRRPRVRRLAWLFFAEARMRPLAPGVEVTDDSLGRKEQRRPGDPSN